MPIPYSPPERRDSYNGNGNLLTDGNKGVTDISYNVNNLPHQVNMGNSNIVQYVYDANGMKLKTVSPGNTTIYAGMFEYSSNGTLQRIGLEEG